MVLTMATGQEDSLLLLLLPTTSPLPPLLAAFLLAAALLWLSPGGPAWALSRCRRPPSGPQGVVTALSSPVAHRTLAALSGAIAGGKSLMAFSVGATRLVVSSHPSTAREILVSPAFGDRPVKDAARHLLFHRAMGFAPSGEAHWRGLRRLAAAHLFGPRRVAGAARHRAAIGEAMASDVSAAMARHGEVSLKRVLHAASLNHVMATVFGKRYHDLATSQEGALLEEMVTEGYDLLGTFNWADHLPLLKSLDLQGVRRRCNRLVQKVEVFVGKIIQEHRVKRANGVVADELTADFVDVLLGLEGEDKLSDSDMIAVLWEMIFRGTDTVAILMEWVMARMVLHPDIQAKAQAELDAVVGDGRVVTDADVASLPYIQCIVKETLRMHPPGPLLSWARLAIHDAHVGGHLVPAGTTAMVNMWAIAHDPAIWAQPEAFRPERFQEEDVSVLGSDLRLAPFGAGRRVCPGKMLALATTHLWIAQLLHQFEWAPRSGGGGVDLSERLNMSLEMATPLVCKAIPRVVQA
ncbi:hypothetical protein HU200_046146 [Digitaria exilis]|uniref:Cytochrome P450 n=1 Tax=Digitaria exilis TaxID=1010633 RepID=A0A835B0G6_9POAL|nr:hypothetical protein HU200_046146 [Digitaria exilis]CAB3458545.1 unnamed protein product [Digitaria exilis]